ncbi:MAG: immunity 26/phosphotriesterase HocA family protein [Phycisphaerales bacterium]|nr:immunity 26/phosphotriesterase HocA family protein [Phycisphaerales bacterium]
MLRRPRNKTVSGTVFTFPLDEGGHAYGLVARVGALGPRRAEFGVVYCFDYCAQRPIAAVTPEMMDPRQVINISTCGLGHLHDGRWTQLGLLPGFAPTDWPVPVEIRPAVSDTLAKIPDPGVARLFLYNKDLSAGELVENRGYVRPEEEPQFPYARGLGDMRYLEGAAEMAIKKRFRLQTVEIREGTFDLWARVRAAIERDLKPRRK